jgi:hypothetical protein
MAGVVLTETSVFTANVVAPVDGDLVTGASVAVGEQALTNRTKYLNDTKAALSGATFTGAVVCSTTLGVTGATTLTGAVSCVASLSVGTTATFTGAAVFNGSLTCNDPATFTDAVTVSSSLAVQTGATLVCQAGSTLSMQGRKRRRSRVQLAATDQSVGPADGDCFELALNTSGVQRIITLLSVTGQTVSDGEVIEFIVPTQTGVTAGSTYRFDRESGVTVATFSMSSTGAAASLTAQFEFVGSAWRLGLNSGWDSAESTGVSPGAGA